MNRFDTALTADLPSEAGITALSSDQLERWSGEDFALAVALARAPATFTSGIGDSLVHLVIAGTHGEDPVAVLPLSVEGQPLSLGLGPRALDGLIGLLGAPVSAGNGANMSLDAIEALCVAIVSPLMRMDAGVARWATMERGVAALKIGDGEMSLHGEPGAILALHSIMCAAGASQSEPLQRLSQPLAQRVAVDVEQIHGVVWLNEEERGGLESGCGILLDTLWPNGRQVVGQRFVRSGSHWQTDADLRPGCLRIRSEAQVRMLGELSLGADLASPSAPTLELVDGTQILAHGHLTSLTMSGRCQTVFQVDQLA